jgi:GNAT superfamily N-acetyltransferase
VKIRPFDADAAPGAADLFREVQPSVVTTAAYLLHREASMPTRARRLSLVALTGDSVVGWGSASMKWPDGPLDEARVWVAVRRPNRRRGLGSELAERVEAHANGAGARTISTIVEDDPAGLWFAERRGYRETGAHIVSALAPRPVEVTLRPGFEVAPLSERGSDERALFELWGEAGAFAPPAVGGEPALEEWQRLILGNPLLEPEGSFTVFAEGRPVALAWLLVDHEQRRAENEWTATLPAFRGQGLARLAKLHTIRWAADHGIREIMTASDLDNVAMLELNRSLGYRTLWRRRLFTRSI